MRKNGAGILFLLVFLSLQFGNMALYVYCKWQATVVQQQQDCGCDTHLTTVFEKKDRSADTPVISSFNETVKTFPPPSVDTYQRAVYVSSINYFAGYTPFLKPGFETSPFHPPARNISL